jgi:diguanylate cyclase (GGDEF)-like protein
MSPTRRALHAEGFSEQFAPAIAHMTSSRSWIATWSSACRNLSNAAAAAILALGLALPGVTSAAGAAQARPAASAAPAARWGRLASTAFQNWSADTSLPHPIVTALAQDADGFIWVGTQDGLARWDGYRFRNYRADAKVAGSLPSSYIDVLHADAQGRLWVGTDNGSLAIHDAHTDRFDSVDLGAARNGTAEFTAIVDDGKGGLWVGSSRGLLHVQAPAPAASGAAQARVVKGVTSDEGVRALMRAADGALWIGTREGVLRCPDPLADERCNPALAEAPSFGQGVNALAQSADGRVWIGTAGAGIFIDDPATGQVQAVADSGARPSTLGTADVITVTVARSGEIWVGTNGDGIVVIDPATLSTRHLRYDPRLQSGLPSDAFFAAIIDRSGLLWYGGRRGLSRTDPDQRALTTVFGQAGAQDGITDTDAPTLMAAADGQLWVGLADNGVDVVDPMGVRTAHLDISRVAGASSAGPGLSAKAPVSSMVQTPDRKVYIGARDGLFRSDGDGRQLRRIPWAAGRSPSINELLLAGDRLWIGARTEGLWSLDVGAGAQATPVRPPGTQALAQERVVALRQDTEGRLWLGTPTGLNIYDPATQRVEHVTSSAADDHSLSNDFVSCILVDHAHRVWIGTLGGGLDLVTGRDAQGRLRFRRFGVPEGLPTPDIGTLLQGSDGAIWASTDGGFAVIDPVTFAIQKVLRADGAAITSYWINSGVVTDHDELVFGGAGGITVVRPRLYRHWDFQPPVVITETRVQGRLVATRPRDVLTLRPGENGFAIEFAALDFSAPERNRYAYRLAGADDAWNDIDATKRVASYTNLGPGRYQLHLRGSNRDGVWSGKDVVLAIDVQPLWYQTWWAHLLEGLAALLAIAAIVRIRTRALSLRKRQLLDEVAARTSELEEKQQELIRANETLAQLANFDPLTLCLNRRAFIEQAEKRFDAAVEEGGSLYCMMADIDHFKFFNDQFGHPVGDAVIRGVATVLQRSLRSGDLICRYGGEEFCMLLVGIDESVGRMLAERIRSRIQREAGRGVREIPGLGVTVSVGLARLGADTPSLDRLIARADAALYAAKHAGRNRVAAGPDNTIASGADAPPQFAGAQ